MKPRETTTPPPYTNRWGTEPGLNFYRCQADNKNGEQCRRAARMGHKTCETHALAEMGGKP